MRTRILTNSLLFTILAVFTFACGEDDAPDNQVVANYIMSLRTQTANEESADYFLAVEDIMTGEISAVGQGVELVGWNYNGKFGNTYFAFGYDLNECIGYKEVDGKLVNQGKFVFERMDVMSALDDENFLAIGAPWGGGSFDCQLQVVNVDDIAIHKNVKHPIYEYFDENGTQLNAWPTASYLDGDQVFISFYPLDGASWATPNTDTAYVSVYSYPELAYIKTIKDARVGPIGYYGGSPAIIKTETGDHYTLSGGAKSTGFTQSTKPSGILKIAAGEDEFDANYFFDVEASGYKVISGAYVGNGLAVARVISKTIDEQASAVNMWATFSEITPLLNVAILDLVNKTVTIVEDVPLHGGQYQTPYLIENGKAYISVNNGTLTHVYEVNPATATAVQGAKLIGNQFQCLFSNK